jgi:hypothetical protein
MAIKFRVRLKDVHQATGLSLWAVHKNSGVALNTVKKYVTPQDLVADRIEGALVSLLKFYKLNWRDPSVIEELQVEENEPA